jgi:hypothetical protein
VVGPAFASSGGVCTLPGMTNVEMIPLAEGATARLYRDGTLLGMVDVPLGRMEVRGLQPGQYEARDEIGGSCFFEVTHETEVVVVQDPEGTAGPVVAADSTRQIDRDPDAPEPTPIYPAAQEHARVEVPHPEYRVTLPADAELEEAGSAGEQPHPVVAAVEGDERSDAIDKLTVKQLQQALRDLGESATGSKVDLQVRLERARNAA